MGNLYQKNVSLKNKKDYGQFYTTNRDIIAEMLKDIDVLSGKILEPSCGSGVFLIEICSIISEKLKIKGKDSNYILNYIVDNVYANDNDEIALKICEINLISTLFPLIIDAYKQNNNFKLNKLNLKCKDFILKEQFKTKFSVIIGNPPYITLYGKRSRNMNETKRKYYNTFDFVQNKQGNNKFNVSMFFIENALKLLKPNGVLIYILDISFFETAYIDIRKYIVENFCIDSMLYNLSEFKNVASGQIILKISNKDVKNNVVYLLDYESKQEKFIKQQEWNDYENDYKFFIPLENIQLKIINKIEKHKTLEYYFPNKSLRTCCALTGKTEDFIAEKDSQHITFPYIEGSKGLTGKFAVPITTRKIKYDYNLQLKISNEFKKELELKGVKNKKRVTLGDKEAYQSPKIFIRQSANEIITTYSEEPYAANNSIYILTNKKQDFKSKQFLKYVCGILNSDLITYYSRIKKIIRTAKGKTPQIKTSDLKKVCISVDKDNYNYIIKLVDGLLKKPNCTKLNAELNNTVFNIYGINNDEIKYITKELENI